MSRFLHLIEDILVAHLNLMMAKLEAFNHMNQWYALGFKDGRAHEAHRIDQQTEGKS